MIISINLISQFHQIKLNWTKTPNRLVSSPRISNFSQIIKLIKLIHKITFILSHNKNPLINFQRKGLNQQKSQNFIGSKFSHNAWKICMKHENKWKRRGIKVLPALEDKNLAKCSRENDKKLIGSLDRSKRERKVVLKKFESDRTRENSKF